MTGGPRVLLFCASAALGGMERVVLGLARLLPAEGLDVHTVLSGEAGGDVAAWFERHGVAARTIPDIWAGGRLARLHAVRRLVLDVRPDVVNCHYGQARVSPVDALAVRSAGSRFVASPHMATVPKRRSARIATRLAISSCAAVVVVNEVLRDHLVAAGVPAARLHVVAGGTAVPAVTAEPAAARGRLGLPPDAAVIGCIAQLYGRKAVGVLIDAVARIPDPDRRIHLVVAGDGPRRARLEEQAARLLPGRVHLLGWLEDPADVYAASDVLALSSRAEGTPLAFGEAAMHGVPAVSFDVGGVGLAIEHGVSGLLVPRGDAGALAAALHEVLHDPERRARMGAAARERALAHSDTDMARRYADVFRHAARRR